MTRIEKQGIKFLETNKRMNMQNNVRTEFYLEKGTANLGQVASTPEIQFSSSGQLFCTKRLTFLKTCNRKVNIRVFHNSFLGKDQ